MGRGKNYTNEYKEMISDLYSSGMSLSEISIVNNNKEAQGVKKMCSILVIPRSTYYSRVNSKPSNRDVENKVIKGSILRIYNDSKSIYGAPRIHAALAKENINISLKKVQRLMQQLRIRSITLKKYKPTSSKKPKECLVNVLKRDQLLQLMKNGLEI